MTTVHRDRGEDRAQRRWLLMAVPAVIVALAIAGPYVTFSFSRLSLHQSVPLHIVFRTVRRSSARVDTAAGS